MQVRAKVITNYGDTHYIFLVDEWTIAQGSNEVTYVFIDHIEER